MELHNLDNEATAKKSCEEKTKHVKNLRKVLEEIESKAILDKERKDIWRNISEINLEGGNSYKYVHYPFENWLFEELYREFISKGFKVTCARGRGSFEIYWNRKDETVMSVIQEYTKTISLSELKLEKLYTIIEAKLIYAARHLKRKVTICIDSHDTVYSLKIVKRQLEERLKEEGLQANILIKHIDEGKAYCTISWEKVFK